MTAINKRIFALVSAGAVLSVLIWHYLPDLFYKPFPENQPSFASRIHAYNDPAENLEKIRIKTVYAVPKDRKKDIKTNWPEATRQTLEKIAAFHEIQFRGKSKIFFDIYPEPVILENDNSYYNSNSTAKGNPSALISVSEEIEKRMFKKEGGLYNDSFAGFGPSEYPVLGIIYEGVSASGGGIYYSDLATREDIAKSIGLKPSDIHIVNIESVDGFFIVSSDFILKKEYEFSGPSVIYHELGHVFGLPDRYDDLTNTPFSSDIMGAGREKALETAYLDRKSTREMGLME